MQALRIDLDRQGKGVRILPQTLDPESIYNLKCLWAETSCI